MMLATLLEIVYGELDIVPDTAPLAVNALLLTCLVVNSQSHSFPSSNPA